MCHNGREDLACDMDAYTETRTKPKDYAGSSTLAVHLTAAFL